MPGFYHCCTILSICEQKNAGERQQLPCSQSAAGGDRQLARFDNIAKTWHYTGRTCNLGEGVSGTFRVQCRAT